MSTDRSVSAGVVQAVKDLEDALARAGGRGVDAAVLSAVYSDLGEARETVREMLRAAGGRGKAGRLSARSRVVEALTGLAVPVRMGLLRHYCDLVLGFPLQERQLSSLRRDELRKVRGGPRAEVLIVPALSPELTPVVGLWCLSTWPGWLRVVGVHSERVGHLRLVFRMLSSPELVSGTGAVQRSPSWVMLQLLGNGIDGITRRGIDVEAARASVTRQLSVIEGRDRDEREAAASRLGREPDPVVRLFGKRPPARGPEAPK